MQAVPDEPNVALRPTADGQEVVLAFPYDGHLVAAVRTLPGRRFDWDRKEWSAPADGWVAAKLSEILRSRPELRRTREFDEWLAATEQHWIGHVRTVRYDGRGWFALDTLAGTPPQALRSDAIELDGRWLVPLTRAAAIALSELREPRLSIGARRCAEALEHGEQPPAARLIHTRSVAGRAAHARNLLGPGDPGGLRAAARSDRQRTQARRLDRRPARCLHHRTRRRSQPPAPPRCWRRWPSSTAPPSARSPPRARPRPSRCPRWRPGSAASWRRSSGSRSATR